MIQRLHKLGLALIVTGISAIGLLAASDWTLASRTPAPPDVVVQSYVRATFARNYADAWELISAPDKQYKTREAYLSENGAFTGLKQELATRLAGWIEFSDIQVDIADDRATVTARGSVPNGNQPALYEIFQSAGRETNPAAARRLELLEQLDRLYAERQIERLEVNETFTLVREPEGWRISMGWADAIVVSFTTDVSPDLDWEFYPLQDEVRARPGETLTAIFRVTNRSKHTLTGKSDHRVLPEAHEPFLSTIEYFCLLPETLEPGQSKDLTLIFHIDEGVPVTARQFEVRFSYYSLETFPDP